MPDTLNVPMERVLHRIPEAAAALGISRTTLYELINSGQIPTVRIGSRGVRIPVKALQEYADRQSDFAR
jgi:excisionase family DNA binding protein